MKSVDGCVGLTATHFSNKIMKPKKFYRGKLVKRVSEGWSKPSFILSDVGETDRSFKVPENIDNFVNFRILTAFPPREVQRNIRDSDGNVIDTEQVFKTVNGQTTDDPLITRGFELLAKNADGSKTVIKNVSSSLQAWIDLIVDYNQTYRAIITESNKSKGFFNITTGPSKVNDRIDIEGLDAENLVDFNTLRENNGKYVLIYPVFGGASFEMKENPEKHTKTAYATVTDLYAGSATILSNNVSIFEEAADESGTLPPVMRILGKPFINEERDTVAIFVYAINAVTDVESPVTSGDVVEEKAGDTW